MGIPTLREGKNVVSSNSGKANVFNTYFKSVFTREDKSTIPDKGISPFTTIDEISFTIPGIEKQLKILKPTKASGPDQISPWVFKNFAHQCAIILVKIFR